MLCLQASSINISSLHALGRLHTNGDSIRTTIARSGTLATTSEKMQATTQPASAPSDFPVTGVNVNGLKIDGELASQVGIEN